MDVERRQMFRGVFRYAQRSGRYDGEGASWGYVKDEQVDRLIEAGDGARVLRSEGFCRRFFPEPIVGYSGPPSGPVPFWNELPREPWEPHHAALQSNADPLGYCWDFLVQRSAVRAQDR